MTDMLCEICEKVEAKFSCCDTYFCEDCLDKHMGIVV